MPLLAGEVAERMEMDPSFVASRYARVRAATEALAAPLSSEDMLVQSMPDASPTKWHLAHTTWFFEEFVLARFDPNHAWHDERWRVLFNSYYEAVGPRHERARRGVLSRPSLDEVRAWRARVDERISALLSRAPADDAMAATLLGTHHEQQHQELLLTDIKHALSANELEPAYRARPPRAPSPGGAAPLRWVACEQRVAIVGDAGEGFAFDNERPQHRAIVGPFAIASRLVTNGELARFIDDGGYERPELWLADGWARRRSEGWQAPLYWARREGAWTRFTLEGRKPLDPEAPVCHVSQFEADAYARWAQARLPTELEWETLAASTPLEGVFVESGWLDPVAESGDRSPLFGNAWQWTASAYLGYPRFRAAAGALGEYNGKFMSGQVVLRGGSCFSPRDHLRATYRNYFPPHARWQMSGIRLARDA